MMVLVILYKYKRVLVEFLSLMFLSLTVSLVPNTTGLGQFQNSVGLVLQQ